MEFTKKDLLIYKKLKQKLSRDKIKKLIKNQEEFNLPDDIISVLRKFRIQDSVGGSKGFSTQSTERINGIITNSTKFSTGSAKKPPSTKGLENDIKNPNLIKAQEYIRKVCDVDSIDGVYEVGHPLYDYKIGDDVALRHESSLNLLKKTKNLKFCLTEKDTFFNKYCKDKKENKTREEIAKELDKLQLSKEHKEKLEKEGELNTYFGKCQNLEEKKTLNREELKKVRADRIKKAREDRKQKKKDKKARAARKKSNTYPNYPETLYQNSLNDIHRYPIVYNFEEYPDYESLQESPAFQQGYQDQMNKYLQESPEYNQGYQDGIEYLQENPNFEEQPLHEIEYYNQQVPLEENPNYVEYPQQQYPNTMETPYGDRYIINYN